MNIDTIIKHALDGDKQALEKVILSIQGLVYNLALRMMANPEDAKETTQEILLKVVTNLGSFQFASHFNTWVYRIATNYLLSEKRVLSKYPPLTFDLYQQDLESDLTAPDRLTDDPQYQLLLNELRISCTMAMLLCLKPAARMTYILGDIYDMNQNEASQILSISKDNFRKQLSRARAQIIEFTSKSCGLVSNTAKCQCERKITGAIQRHRVIPDNHFFSTTEQNAYTEIQSSLLTTQHDLKTLSLQKSIKLYKCPIELSATIESLVNQGLATREWSTR